MEFQLSIMVYTKWVHPEFGGQKEEVKTFPISCGESAEEYYREQWKNDDLYRHTVISIIHEPKE